MKCPHCKRNITLEGVIAQDVEYNLYNFDGKSATLELQGCCPNCDEELSISVDIHGMVFGKAMIV